MTRRAWAWPLWPFYAAATGIKDALYAKGVLKPKQLVWPVVSVGSISAGGAGKTPVVIALAKLLKGRSWHVSVLSRGYGRDRSGGDFAQEVVPERENAAVHYGDEPVLLAREAKASVWVSADRYSGGKLAEAVSAEDIGTIDEGSFRSGDGPVHVDVTQPPAIRGIHLLDDGFQHRQLARTLDIALVTLEDLDDELLPVGNLREAPYALHRAHVLVIREEERKKILPRLRALDAHNKPLWTIRRALRFPAPHTQLSAGLKPLAFCALARPGNFEAMLREAGCGVTDTFAFRDHHVYTPGDMQRILATAKKLTATGFVTTEKDAVKLTEPMRSTLENFGPLLIVALEATFEDEAAVLRDIEARLA